MSKRPLRVVEMLIDGRWEPTVGVRLSRSDGRDELREWQQSNPADEFRLAPYVPRKERR